MDCGWRELAVYCGGRYFSYHLQRLNQSNFFNN